MVCLIVVLVIVEVVLCILCGMKIIFSYWGMVVVYFGLVVIIVGIVFSQNYSVECDVCMKFGDSVDIYEYCFIFCDVKEVIGLNWCGGVVIIGVMCDGKLEMVLYVEKCYYNIVGLMMIEVVIDGGIMCDLYVVFGEELENGVWVVCFYYKLFVCWIWVGGLMMVLGGLLCLFDFCYCKCVSL